MYKILEKEILKPQVERMVIDAPMIAHKAKAGQFIILRVHELGERIPLTIAGSDAQAGTVEIIYQVVGLTTKLLSELNAGDHLHDFVGPLGKPSEFEGMSKVAVVGGGLGCAIAYPQAKALFALGAHVDIIAGFRSRDLVILEKEMAACGQLYMMTDDGTYGERGFVTKKLQERIEAGAGYDTVIAIGPLIMMKFVCKLTEKHGIKTTVSMNPIMIDGTGMCGGCRLTVDGKTKFACVDGPDFDGHLVDFDEAMARNAFYQDFEGRAREKACRLYGKGVG